MKQREFVVVVFRLLAFWFAIQAVINFIQGITDSAMRHEDFMSIAVLVVAVLLVVGLAAVIWTKSEQLMLRVYAGSESWDTSTVEYEDIAETEELEVAETEESNVADTEVLVPESVEPEYYESATSFSTGITTKDILMTFMMALGLWLLVSSIPRIILLAFRYAGTLSYKSSDTFTAQFTEQLIYWGVQLGFGFLLIKPRKILEQLWKINSPLPESVESETVV